MKHKEAGEEFEKLAPEEKKQYSSFADYLGSNGLIVCEGCDDVVEYDEVDESGYCLESCSSEEEEEEEE